MVVSTKRGAGLSDGDVEVTIRQEVGFQNLDKFIDLAEHHAFALADDWESESNYTKYAGWFIPGYMGRDRPTLWVLESLKIISTWIIHLQ